MTIFWRYIVGAAVACIVMPAQVNAQQVKVPITPYQQEHSLSCEIATLKMALSTHGIAVSEDELIAKLPFDLTPKQNGIWGNPLRAFVGNINGRMLIDGYGVYWKPIADVGSTYATTKVLEHGSAQDLAREISQGNSVIIWGYYGTQRQVFSWTTPQGTQVNAINGEHTRVVYGFDGPVTAPTQFYLLDPSSGAFSWSTAELMHNWSSLNHMGVIVGPKKTWVRLVGASEIWEINSQTNTRQWVTSWQTFIDRGGTVAAVEPVSQETLLRYKVGAPITK